MGAMERFNAGGLVLTSESNVILRFPDGDKAAKQLTTHADVMAIVEEIAPRGNMDKLRQGRGGHFEYVANAVGYVVAVDVVDPTTWRVMIALAKRSSAPGIIPAASAQAAMATPRDASPSIAPPLQPAPAFHAPTPLPTKPFVASAPGATPAAAPVVAKGGAPVAATAAVVTASTAAPKIHAPSGNAKLPRGVDRRVWLDGVLAQTAAMKASDLLLAPKSPVRLRFCGVLIDHTDDPLSDEDTEGVLRSALSDAQWSAFEMEGEVDLSYPVADVGRFRVNVYRQHNGICACFHYIPLQPPTLAELGLPAGLAKVMNYHQGMVLVTGPVGCGKSSTMAALVNLINEDRHDHILTIEDPIEYKHVSKGCIVNQREVKRDTTTFARALRAALREDPDVICIGELRDLETISLAMSAAETGHLVIGTLHTNNVIRTINRLVGVFPPNQQSQVRSMMSESLRAVISQRLLPRADGTGVALAHEMLFVTRAVSNLIRENRAFQIGSILQTGKSQGQVTLDQSLVDLVKAGTITPETAAANSERPELFQPSTASTGASNAPA